MKPGEVKICGTTDAADLAAAVAAGADAIGLICPPRTGTRHSIDASRAVRLARAVPAGMITVLIPRLTDPVAIITLANAVRPDRLQLGETEDLELLKTVAAAGVASEIAQVIHVADRSAVAAAKRFAESADIIHLDSVGEQPGGTGRTHDWEVSREIADAVQAAGKQVILAGGLTAANVAQAIATVRPDGVDVETGIKDGHGRHDPAVVAAFVTAARAVFRNEARTGHP